MGLNLNYNIALDGELERGIAQNLPSLKFVDVRNLRFRYIGEIKSSKLLS